MDEIKSRLDTAFSIADEIGDVIKSGDTSIHNPHTESELQTNPHLLQSLINLSDEHNVEVSLSLKKDDTAARSELISKLNYHRDIKLKRRNQRRFYIGSAAAAVVILAVLGTLRSIETSPESSTDQTIFASEVIDLEVPVIYTHDNQTHVIKNKSTVDYTAENTHIADILPRHQHKDYEAAETETLVVPSRCTQSVILTDGSCVHLNANSSLSFPAMFPNNERVVKLKGEAYFEIKNSTAPFKVITDEVTVTVYGTKFNVKNRGKIETALLEGSVGVTTAQGEEVKMTPGQLYYYDNDSGTGKLIQTIPHGYLAWLEESFIWKSTPLRTILQELSVWYGISFETDKGVDLNRAFDIYTQRSLEPMTILEIIESVSNIKFKEEGGRYMVTY